MQTIGETLMPLAEEILLGGGACVACGAEWVVIGPDVDGPLRSFVGGRVLDHGEGCALVAWEDSAVTPVVDNVPSERK